jgi:hypothetical protein
MNLQVNENRREKEKKNNRERKLMNENTLLIRVELVPDRKLWPG